MIKHDDVALLQMEAVQVVKGVFGLFIRICQPIHDGEMRMPDEKTYIHHILKYYERGTLRLLLVSDSYLSYAAIAPKEIVEVLSRNLIVQVLDEKNTVRTRGKLGL